MNRRALHTDDEQYEYNLIYNQSVYSLFCE
jgi:hypothetical protein